MSIKNRLSKKVKLKLFQGQVEASLYDRFIKNLRSEKIRHREFLEAAIKDFLEEK